MHIDNDIMEIARNIQETVDNASRTSYEVGFEDAIKEVEAFLNKKFFRELAIKMLQHFAIGRKYI